MILSSIVMILIFVYFGMVEINKYDDMILSFQRYLTYSLFAACLILLTVVAYFKGIFHPILIVLDMVSVLVLIQSFKPVQEGTINCYHSFKRWLKR